MRDDGVFAQRLHRHRRDVRLAARLTDIRPTSAFGLTAAGLRPGFRAPLLNPCRERVELSFAITGILGGMKGCSL